MQMVCESEKLDDYLLESDEVNYSNPKIRDLLEEIFHPFQTEIEKVKVAFEFVRDEIFHSWDIQGRRVTCNASDVLVYREGIRDNFEYMNRVSGAFERFNGIERIYFNSHEVYELNYSGGIIK